MLEPLAQLAHHFFLERSLESESDFQSRNLRFRILLQIVLFRVISKTCFCKKLRWLRQMPVVLSESTQGCKFVGWHGYHANATFSERH